MKQKSSELYGLLRPAMKYIEEKCFCADLSIGFLAKACGISEVYFRKVFIKQVGVPPKQYIIDLRVERAKQLLSGGEMKVGEIAGACGFENQYHFSRLFRKKTGFTPTEYMQKDKFKI